jgi:hypothetical protein
MPEEPSIWWDGYWNCWVWSSGTCPTDVSPDGFVQKLLDEISSILCYADDLSGGYPILTGGHESSCHSSGSLHYSGQAIDISISDWPPGAAEDLTSYCESRGLRVLDEGSWLHISALIVE